MKNEKWVNANITLTIPLDGVTVDDSPYDKQEAVVRAMDRVMESLPAELAENVCVGTWEDATYENEYPTQWAYEQACKALETVKAENRSLRTSIVAMGVHANEIHRIAQRLETDENQNSDD